MHLASYSSWLLGSFSYLEIFTLGKGEHIEWQLTEKGKLKETIPKSRCIYFNLIKTVK